MPESIRGKYESYGFFCLFIQLKLLEVDTDSFDYERMRCGCGHGFLCPYLGTFWSLRSGMTNKNGAGSGKEVERPRTENRELVRIPTLILSAKNDEESHLVGKEIGADSLLGRPFNAQELVSTVRNLIQLMSNEKYFA